MYEEQNRTEQIKLFCGDSSKVLKSIPDESIDLTVTSPPYDDLRKYNGYTFDFKTIAEELYRITKIGGVIVWIVNDATINGSETGTSFKQALYFKKIGFNLHDTMIWEKPSFSATGSLKVRYAPVFEYMFVFVKGKLKTFNPIMDKENKYFGAKIEGTVRQKDGSTRKKNIVKGSHYIKQYGQRHNVWKISAEKNNNVNKIHPAVFPIALVRDHIISWSNKGDTVLDCFMGSGTTGIAAMMLNRKFIGIEISEEYFKIAKERIKSTLSFPCINCGFECDEEDKKQCSDYKKWLRENG